MAKRISIFSVMLVATFMGNYADASHHQEKITQKEIDAMMAQRAADIKQHKQFIAEARAKVKKEQEEWDNGGRDKAMMQMREATKHLFPPVKPHDAEVPSDKPLPK